MFQSGWDWVAVEGDADLAGPDDPLEGLDGGDLPCVLREVYAAAVGGAQDQWSGLDEVMEMERHTAVLVTASRVYTNPVISQTDHKAALGLVDDSAPAGQYVASCLAAERRSADFGTSDARTAARWRSARQVCLKRAGALRVFFLADARRAR